MGSAEYQAVTPGTVQMEKKGEGLEVLIFTIKLV